MIVAETQTLIVPDSIRISPVTLERDTRESIERILAAFADLRRGGLKAIARLLGGAWASGDVPAATGDAGDVEVKHDLNRIPSVIVQSVDIEGLGGMIYGSPDGGRGAAGGNQARWTSEAIFVRASRSSTYEFVVI